MTQATELVYPDGKGPSYFADLANKMRGTATVAAENRLEQHAQQTTNEDGQQAVYVPPLHLMREAPTLLAQQMPYVSCISQQSLPKGTDSINCPTVAGGDPEKNRYINAPVRTIAGQQGAWPGSWLDQSPIMFDPIIWRDLLADYAENLTHQVLNGTGTQGQLLGARHEVQRIEPESQRAADAYAALRQAVLTILQERFLPPTAVVMHPRRWAALTDNLVAADQWVKGGPGVVGSAETIGKLLFTVEEDADPVHIPVVCDTHMIEDGRDFIHVMVAGDLTLWSSNLRARVIPSAPGEYHYPDTLLFQVYAYAAFTAQRYKRSVVEVGPFKEPGLP